MSSNKEELIIPKNFRRQSESIQKFTLEYAAFRLYQWQHFNDGSFYCLLYDMISRSDIDNKLRFKKGFNNFVSVYELWLELGDSIFKKFGVLNESKN